MRLTKVPKHSAAELERREEQLLRDACGWPPSIPVDIESLVDRDPGVLLDILPGLQALCGVVGIARYESDVEAHLAERLARLHAVSAAAMRYRLKEWPLRIAQKIERAMRERLMSLE